MLQLLIRQKTLEWLNQPDCSILPVVEYIRKKGKFRDAQMMREDFFNEYIDLAPLLLPSASRLICGA
jgi:hypothetical protein